MAKEQTQPEEQTLSALAQSEEAFTELLSEILCEIIVEQLEQDQLMKKRT